MLALWVDEGCLCMMPTSMLIPQPIPIMASQGFKWKDTGWRTIYPTWIGLPHNFQETARPDAKIHRSFLWVLATAAHDSYDSCPLFDFILRWHLISSSSRETKRVPCLMSNWPLPLLEGPPWYPGNFPWEVMLMAFDAEICGWWCNWYRLLMIIDD